MDEELQKKEAEKLAADQATADDLRKQLATTQQEANAFAETVLAGIPEKMKALVPEGLSHMQKAQWVVKAQALGVFNPQVPETDGGRKPTVTPKNLDVLSLPPIARMAHGYTRK